MRALPYRPLAASQLAQYVGKRVWVAGWPITRKEVMTKAREPMEFFSFEDQTAIYETVFFPKAFQRFCQELNMDRAYLLYGRVESEFGTVSLNVERVRKLNPLYASQNNLHVFRRILPSRRHTKKSIVFFVSFVVKNDDSFLDNDFSGPGPINSINNGPPARSFSQQGRSIPRDASYGPE